MTDARTLWTRENNFSMSDGDLKNLILFIRDHSGIVLRDYQTDNLRNVVSEVCEHFGIKDAASLISRLQSLPSNAPEREFLISRVTIGESYFFRDEGQISFLRHTWLPDIIKQKRKIGDKSLSIWCAGCSNGQEPYTISMLLEEAIYDLEDWDISILGTDINAYALRSAVAGCYSSWSFRITPDAIRDRFFTYDGSSYSLNDNIRARVKFSYLNLVTDPFPALMNHTSNLDMILCRNVFIYFDREAIAQIISKFTSCLVLGGHLVVGASDPVTLENKGLVYTNIGGTGYFRRSDGQVQQSVSSHNKIRSSAGSALSTRSQLKPAFKSRPADRKAKNPSTEISAPSSSSGDVLFKLIGNGDWLAAFSEIEIREAAGLGSPDLDRSKIKVMANMGRLDDALSLCEALVAAGNTDKHNHFMLGLIRLDTDDAVGAKKAFHSAIFLDRTFMEAHYQLAMILIRAGNKKKGLKSLQNALALAKVAPPDRVLHESAGMTMERMIDVLHQSIVLYGEA